MVINMITWVLKKEQLNENFTLDELEEFSRKHDAKIIVKNFCKIISGRLTWMNKKIKKNLLH